MDEIRRFRLLITPFVYFAWLMFGIWLRDEPTKWGFAQELSKNGLAGAAVALLVATTIPCGYFLNSLSLWLSSLLFYVKEQHVEALPDLFGPERETNQVANAIWRHLKIDGAKARAIRKHEVYATATLAYGVVEDEVGSWVTRRWATFNIGLNSATTIVAAGVTWWAFFTVRVPLPWFCLTIALPPVFIYSAWNAWTETIGMLRFQALREFDEPTASPRTCSCEKREAPS